MKKIVMICSVVLAFIGLSASVFPGFAQEIEPEVKAKIVAMLTKHDKALSEQDLDGVMATFSPSRTIVLLGTGPGERWVGEEEIRDAYTHFFMDFDPGTLSTECTWSSADVQGNIAWISTMCNFTDYFKNLKREYAINISTILEEIDGQWYFVHFHFSNLTDLD